MDLTKYIIRILGDSHQITIPSLGRFELIFESVKIDLETEKTSPPNYRMVFSQQHDLNDNSVAHKIAQSESKNEEEINNEIIQTISDWKSRLKTGGSLQLDKFGIFISDKEKIEFRMSDDCILNFKNFGLPSI